MQSCTSVGLRLFPWPQRQREVRRCENALPTSAASPSSVPKSTDTDYQSLRPGAVQLGSATRRKGLQYAFLALVTLHATPLASVSAQQSVTQELADAFDKAFASAGDLKKADAAWTEAIKIEPRNSAAWSNRGTIRLQAGRWEEARADLERALELDDGTRSGVLLNNLGNAQAATGDWKSAMENFLAAAEDPDIGTIGLANHALASFQVRGSILNGLSSNGTPRIAHSHGCAVFPSIKRALIPAASKQQ